MDIQTTLWGFSLIQNQPIQPAKIGDIESRNNVDAIDVLSIEKTYVKNAKEKQMPIKKSFLSKLLSSSAIGDHSYNASALLLNGKSL